eukprot:CAMPEP_0177626906 /NCGR_PEP_ID=MMETSP0419_2-20121207/30913_1 /TAXON_ID=582737 /ORGANISM="Tetraselmis sp., Strain GSL018" /LENGTH=284 /DNA_ID=CAMNT_0019128011 /DNA_START=219 /DNA_END=1071 /DNA_ORIENTATION=+
MSLSYPEPTVFPAKEEHKATVIILHGLGDTAAGWASLANMFSIPGVKFIFPTAPMRPITLNMGMVMTGWYDISSLEEVNQKEDEQGIRESWRYVEGLVAQEEASGIPSSKVVVGGFSQGGAIAMMAARSDKKFAGIVGLSTYVPLRDDAGGIVSEANRTTPILMCHGKSDMVINFEYGSGSANLLSEKGASVSFKEYPYMGHEACIEELEAVKEFLGAAVQEEGHELPQCRARCAALPPWKGAQPQGGEPMLGRFSPAAPLPICPSHPPTLPLLPPPQTTAPPC